MMERRKTPRVETLLAGKIVFNQAATEVDCTIRNFSEGGACLEMASTLGIPDAFYLSVASTVYRCTMRWRGEDQIGVSFGD